MFFLFLENGGASGRCQKLSPPSFSLPSKTRGKKTRAHLVFLSGRHRKKRKPWNKRENIVFPLPPPAHEFIFTTMGPWVGSGGSPYGFLPCSVRFTHVRGHSLLAKKKAKGGGFVGGSILQTKDGSHITSGGKKRGRERNSRTNFAFSDKGRDAAAGRGECTKVICSNFY